MKDLLTYADVSGQRRLRSYVKVSIFILAALIVLAVVAFWQQAQQRQAIAVTKPVAVAQTVAPVSTITTAPSATPEACPSDPEDWTLVEGLPGTEFMRIEPACVYEGLERTIAWSLAIREGYSRQAAADALVFEKMPIVRLEQVVVANPNGPLITNVVKMIDVPKFTEWLFREDGKPAVTMALQGCFNTYTIVGNEKKNWDENGYPVICRVAFDNEATGGMICMDDQCYATTHPSSPNSSREFILFGYAGDLQWMWLGAEKDTRLELEPQTMSNDREISTQAQGVGPWDRDWLKQAYGLETQPLLENWQSLTDQANLQKVMDAVKADPAWITGP